MKCINCARKLNADTQRCPGCGTYTPVSKLTAGQKLSRVMKMRTRLGKLVVWQVTVMTLVFAIVLSAGVIAGPSVYTAVKNAIAGIDLPKPEPDTPEEPTTVPKPGRFLYVDLSLAEVDCDEQYPDGSYKLHAVQNGAINIYVYRRAPLGIYLQAAQLYPNIVEEPGVYDEGMSIGEYPVTHAQIPAVYTQNNCVVDILFFTDGEYDHMLVTETPADEYNIHSAALQQLFGSIAMYEMVYTSDTDVV